MIHVITVHHKSAQWIDVQLSYLRRHLHEPYRVIGNLEGVEQGHDQKFDRVIPAIGRHSGKLNYMAAETVAQAAGDDILMFIDGDAFPIADPMPIVHSALADAALIAVQRTENSGDPQPHPSFCAIRAEDWIRLRGDWSMGYSWETELGEPVSDSGGNLLATLDRESEKWIPLLRSNRVNPHPLWFGVYGDIIYHHGAGFRIALARSISSRGPRQRHIGQNRTLIGTALRKVSSARALSGRIATSRRAGDSGLRSLRRSRKMPTSTSNSCRRAGPRRVTINGVPSSAPTVSGDVRSGCDS